MDILITHNQQKYIIETKVWRGDRHYQAGKRQLAAYLKLEGTTEGYYVVFDHRQDPKSHLETETIDGIIVRSYVIPVVQERPSNEPYTSENLNNWQGGKCFTAPYVKSSRIMNTI